MFTQHERGPRDLDVRRANAAQEPGEQRAPQARHEVGAVAHAPEHGREELEECDLQKSRKMRDRRDRTCSPTLTHSPHCLNFPPASVEVAAAVPAHVEADKTSTTAVHRPAQSGTLLRCRRSHPRRRTGSQRLARQPVQCLSTARAASRTVPVRGTGPRGARLGLRYWRHS
jgi:hypothetical protein